MSNPNAVGQICTGIDSWLRAEISESHRGRNVVLDDYAQARHDFLAPQRTEDNRSYGKMMSHWKRFITLTNLIDRQSFQNDYLVGKLIHHSLIMVSGGYRTQCFLQTPNAAEYEAFRFGMPYTPNSATTIPINEVVQPVYGQYSTEFDPEQADFGDVISSFQAENDAVCAAQRSIYAWFAENPVYAQSDLYESQPPVQAAKEQQRHGLVLAASTIAIAAIMRGGDVSRVPFLEPKSISDVSQMPIYPIPNW